MKPLYLDNDHVCEMDLTQKHTDTSLWVPAVGQAGLSFRISLTDGGSAVHASLSVSATERPAKPGTYFATLQGNDLRTHLAAYIGTIVWEVFGDGTNVTTSEPRKVVEHRRP